jgi:hypothetical protein
MPENASSETLWIRRICGLGILFSSVLISSIPIRRWIFKAYSWTGDSIIVFSLIAALFNFTFAVALAWAFYRKGFGVIIIIIILISGFSIFYPEL